MGRNGKKVWEAHLKPFEICSLTSICFPVTFLLNLLSSSSKHLFFSGEGFLISVVRIQQMFLWLHNTFPCKCTIRVKEFKRNRKHISSYLTTLKSCGGGSLCSVCRNKKGKSMSLHLYIFADLFLSEVFPSVSALEHLFWGCWLLWLSRLPP